MAEISDIEIAVEAAGTEEAKSDLESVDQQLEETGDELGENAEQMNDFADKWRGAMGAVVTGLAVAATGLLSQIPVLGQAFAGIKAVVEGIAFQMDKVLRPVLSPIANAFFQLSEAIFGLEGAGGTAVGILGSLGAVLGVVGAALSAIYGPATVLSGALSGLSGVATAVTAAVGALATALGLPVAVVGALIAAVGALVAVLAFDFLGIRTKLIEFITGLGSAIASLASDTVNFAGNMATALANFASNVANEAGNIASYITSVVGSLPQKAYNWGRDLIEELIEGIKSKIGDLKDVVDNVAQKIRDRLPSSPAATGPLSDLDRVGPGLVETVSSGINANTGQVGSASENLASDMDPRTSGAGVSGGSTDLAVFVDGRQVSQGTARYRDDSTLRRGRPK